MVFKAFARDSMRDSLVVVSGLADPEQKKGLHRLRDHRSLLIWGLPNVYLDTVKWG